MKTPLAIASGAAGVLGRARFVVLIAVFLALAACKPRQAGNPGSGAIETGHAKPEGSSGSLVEDAMVTKGVHQAGDATLMLELTVDYDVDEILSYELELGADGCLRWSLESSDGASEWIHDCRRCGQDATINPWLDKVRELRSKIELEDADSPLDDELLAAFNAGHRRYWLVLVENGQRLRPKRAADYSPVRELAVEIWAQLEKQQPRWDTECERRPADDV